MIRVLLTGGAGFIGSHTCIRLQEQGYQVTILDNFINSSQESINRVKRLTGSEPTVYVGDVRDEAVIQNIFVEAKKESMPIDAVIHFAGLKAVGDSVQNPLEYWSVNTLGTLNLLKAMQNNNCKCIVFSSTSTIYGDRSDVPLVETMMGNPVHPYGQSKYAVEKILEGLSKNEGWQISCLRYFNPVGAHPSGLLGEDPNGIPNNLFPFITQVAAGRREKLNIFGDCYSTHDGTGVRDYIHVMDLADAHLNALDFLLNGTNDIYEIINIGTGVGLSVLDVVKGFETYTKIRIPYEIVGKRKGDVSVLIGSAKKAESLLNWKSKKSLEDMCIDGWKWQSLNPYGYAKQ